MVDNRTEQWLRPAVSNMSAYVVADAKGMIKLDAMENPYQLLEQLRAELRVKLSEADLNRYPDPSASRLRNKLKQVMQVPEDKSIVLGNGSDELIQMLAMAVAEDDVCLMSFDPGFVMYKMIADFVGIDYIGVSLCDDFTLDQHKPGGDVVGLEYILSDLAIWHRRRGKVNRKTLLRVEPTNNVFVVSEHRMHTPWVKLNVTIDPHYVSPVWVQQCPSHHNVPTQRDKRTIGKSFY